jgi:hypothetical protein
MDSLEQCESGFCNYNITGKLSDFGWDGTLGKDLVYAETGNLNYQPQHGRFSDFSSDLVKYYWFHV